VDFLWLNLSSQKNINRDAQDAQDKMDEGEEGEMYSKARELRVSPFTIFT
jgi:hypothetical protein